MDLDPGVLLRKELKEWERLFFESNEGRKPGRDDIKACPEIAFKYKEYNKLKSAPLIENPNPPAARVDTYSTPSKRRKLDSGAPVPPREHSFETPKKVAQRPGELIAQDAVYDSPQSIKKFLDSSRKTIGPTPQKDGLVLGLFDLFSAQRTAKEKSDKTDTVSLLPAHAFLSPVAARTRTPQSSSKRRSLAIFMTPTKQFSDSRPFNDLPTLYKTPDFLKRSHTQILKSNAHQAVNENEDGVCSSPEAILPRRPSGRGLSLMLAGIRKMEDDKLDEEMELLREAEMEEQAPGISRSPAPQETMPQSTESQTDVEEEFDPAALLMPEEDLSTDSEVEARAGDRLDRNGQPRRVWKKKGQKRTTRRVIMRPTKSKPVSAVVPTRGDQLDLQEGEDQEDELARDGGPGHSSRVVKDPKTSIEARNKKSRVNVVKTTARKIKASAHANFRRLKIRGRSKPQGGSRGRFNRRR